MKTRRMFLKYTAAAFTAILGGGVCADASLPAQERKDSSEENLTPEIVCRTLYVRTTEEEAFVGKCFGLRDEGVLPNRILYTAYRYAVKKTKSKRFSYFKYTIVKLCRENNVVLDDRAG